MILALDFETANMRRGSICSIGLAWAEAGKIVRSFETLVKPHRSCAWFDPENVMIHGITPEMVERAPEWDEVWAEIAPEFSQGATVIAHNAAFDMSVLRAAQELYHLPNPAFEYFCTYRAAKRIWPHLPNHRLNTVCDAIGHSFRHHDAAADADAAARALLRMLEESGAGNCAELAARAELCLGRVFPGGYSPCGVLKKRKTAR